MTSCPASTARAAATAESTPPDIAASTFIVSLPPSSASRLSRARSATKPTHANAAAALHAGRPQATHCGERLYVGRVEEWPSENLSVERASASLQPIAISTWLGCEPRPSRPLPWNSQSQRIQQHQDGVGRAAREANVGDAGKAIVLRGWAVHDRPRNGGQHELTSSVRSWRIRCSSSSRFLVATSSAQRTQLWRRHRECRSVRLALDRRHAGSEPTEARDAPARHRFRRVRPACAP